MRIPRWMAGLCLAFLFDGTALAAARKVLVVDSYHAEYAWSKAYHQAIVNTLGDKAEVSFFQMDTKRLPKDQHQGKADEALKLIADSKPDLVITGDDAALRYVGARLSGSSLPIVYLGINNNPRNYIVDEATNITGVLERPLIQRNVALIRQLVPNLKRALLLFDGDLTSQVINEEIFVGRGVLRIGDIEVELVRCYDFDAWQKQVEEAPRRYQAIWAGLYQTLRDSQGKVVPDSQVINWTAKHSKLPVFGFWDFVIGPDKAVGGLVLSGKEQGQQAAEIAKQILFQRRSPGSIFPVNTGSGELMFSRSGLQRYGLKLPDTWLRQVRFVE